MPKKKEPSLIEYATKELITDADDMTLVRELQSRGNRVELKPVAGEGFRRIEVLPDVDEITFAVVSDTHLASKYQQLSHLLDFYDYAEANGAQFVVHAGDITDGLHTVHRGAMVYEQFAHGFEAQTDYAASVYPTNLKTYAINGNHDLWAHTNVGANVAKTLELKLGKDVFEYIGDEGAYMPIGPFEVYVMHPAGGPAYARSYKLQKWIEQVPPEMKPNMVFLGNWHIQAALSFRNMMGYLVPCFQSQTPYERRKGLWPEVGGYVLTVRWDERGKISGTTTDLRFYREPLEKDY